MRSYHPAQSRGFTIIETLVAVAILMISIAGPLTVAHKGLLAALYAQDQVTASYLAQDAMEYIKNIRDYNLILKNSKGQEQDWLATLSVCTQSNPCSVDTLNYYTDSRSYQNGVQNCVPSGDTCVIWKNDTGYQHQTTDNQKTKFSRYFYLLDTLDDNEKKVVVKVEWNNGLVKQVVKYENNIFNVVR